MAQEGEPNQFMAQEGEPNQSMAQEGGPHQNPIPRACIWRESFA